MAVSLSGPGRPPEIADFFEALSEDEAAAQVALERIAAGWRDGYAALLVDMARLLPASPQAESTTEWVPPAAGQNTAGGGERSGHVGLPRAASPFPGAGPERATKPSAAGLRARERLVRFLALRTGQRFGDDLRAWQRWYWNRPYDPHPGYATFKAALYSTLDPRLADFFRDTAHARVRLDEIDWGGVGVDSIPPLDHPRTESTSEAGSWLRDEHRVFGVVAGGEARAYPQRIVGWHELVRDTLGGQRIALVYCTLCGSAVPYRAEAGGRTFTFGTSGLLYRSNKLMYDAETRSLWSATAGRAVVGPLARVGTALPALPVVTTTWGEWRRMHPATRVLSRQTGHRRDYAEGAAYRDYFATDRLMFAVPQPDARLKNKDTVLALVDHDPAGNGGGDTAIAVASERLRREPVLSLDAPGGSLVILTTPGGASRAYRSGARTFRRLLAGGRVEDETGALFEITEDALVAVADAGDQLPRVAARNAFWFGWVAQHPGTQLIR